MAPNTDRYSIQELADLVGVSRRTVRYYVQRGLLDPPAGGGRGSHYSAEHLERLRAIRALQEAGTSLDGIRHQLADVPEPPPTTAPRPRPRPLAPTAEPWSRVVLADGLELHARGPRPTPDQLRLALATLRQLLHEGGEP